MADFYLRKFFLLDSTLAAIVCATSVAIALHHFLLAVPALLARRPFITRATWNRIALLAIPVPLAVVPFLPPFRIEWTPQWYRDPSLLFGPGLLVLIAGIVAASERHSVYLASEQTAWQGILAALNRLGLRHERRSPSTLYLPTEGSYLSLTMDPTSNSGSLTREGKGRRGLLRDICREANRSFRETPAPPLGLNRYWLQAAAGLGWLALAATWLSLSLQDPRRTDLRPADAPMIHFLDQHAALLRLAGGIALVLVAIGLRGRIRFTAHAWSALYITGGVVLMISLLARDLAVARVTAWP